MPKKVNEQATTEQVVIKLDDEHPGHAPDGDGFAALPGHPDQQRQQKEDVVVKPDDVGGEHHRQRGDDEGRFFLPAAKGDVSCQ